MRVRLKSLAAALGRAGRLTLREDSLLTSAYVGGLAVAATGVALIFLPAGLIAGGLASAASAVLYARGRGGTGDGS